MNGDKMNWNKLFQSTLLMRGATGLGFCCSILLTYFNPRSSCEERLHHGRPAGTSGHHFNPRSSCEERLAS